jgi:hypothetical protein
MTIVWVEGSEIRRNVGRAQRGEPIRPPVVVQDGTEILRGFQLQIYGPSKIVYQPENPLQNGVVLWIETDAPVLLDESYR